MRTIVTHIWVLAVAAVIWELAARAVHTFYFPPLSTIFRHAYQMWFSGSASTLWVTPEFRVDVLSSLGRVALGLLIAIVLGVLLGIAIGLMPIIDDFLDPALQFARAIPPVALVPIFMLLLGIGTSMKIFLIAFTVVWPILLNTIAGVRSIEPLHRETARIFNIGLVRRLTHIVLPSVTPVILTGLRVSTALGLIVMVLSEMVAATSGLGYRLLFEQQRFDLTNMWACIFLLGLVGYGLNMTVILLEKLFLKWQPVK